MSAQVTGEHRSTGMLSPLTAVVALLIALLTVGWLFFSRALAVARTENVIDPVTWSENEDAWQYDVLHGLTVLGGLALVVATVLIARGRRRSAVKPVALFLLVLGLWIGGQAWAAG